MRRRVLIAQPSPTLQMLMRLTLSPEGLSVECVDEGRAALRAARESAPDLLVVDSALPGIDGYGVIEVLRGEAATRTTPALLIVPDYERPDARRLQEVGIQEVLVRPFEQHELLARVRGLLGPGEDAPAAALPAAGARAAGSGGAGGGRVDEARVQELVDAAVEARLGALVEAAVEARLDALMEERLGDALDEALAKVVPHAVARMQNELGRRTEAALKAAADATVRDLMDTHARELLVPLLEPIVWKVVPELAEDLIRQEIRRLTEEGDA